MTRTVVSYNRIRAGKKAQTHGKAFENLFRSFCSRQDILCLRFPDGCERRGMERGRPRLVAVKTPFDWILSIPGRAAFVDTKSIGDARFSYSKVKDHQVDAMHELELRGHFAGYVVHFQMTKRVIFYWASQLKALKQRESLVPEQGVDLGLIYDLKVVRLFGIYPSEVKADLSSDS
jgi:hypothetical protein